MKKNHSKNKSKFSFKNINYDKILFIFMTVLFVCFFVFVKKSNLLPLKYFIIFIVVLLLWEVALYFLLAHKKKNTIKRRIFGCTISGFLIVLMGIIFYYLNSTLGFFQEFGNNEFKEENYLILVLNDSEFQKLEELEEKKIGYVSSEISTIEQAVSKLSESVNVQVNKYEQYDKLMEELINKQIDAMVVEENYLSILIENEDYEDLFRTLYTINIKTEIKVSKEADVTKKAFAVYISGIDTYGKIANVSRSDVNIVAVINPVTKQVLLVSTPRDYYVQLRGTTGYKDKLTHAGIYGIETSVGTLEDLLDVDIHYYFRVNFTSLERIVDALGGVDVYSKYDFYSSKASGGTYHFTKGYNHLTGKQALSFSRERKRVPGGDRTRGINQQAVIDGVIRKATSSAIITKYNNLLKSLEGTFQTNMTDKDIQKLIKMQLNDMAKWNVTSYSLDGTDSYNYTYSAQHTKLYVMEPKEEIVLEAQSLIDRVFNGEVLEGSYGEVNNVKNPVTIIPSKPKEEPEEETPEEPTVDEPEVPEDTQPENPTDDPIENPEDITNPDNPLSPVDPEQPNPEVPEDTQPENPTDNPIEQPEEIPEQQPVVPPVNEEPTQPEVPETTPENNTENTNIEQEP